MTTLRTSRRKWRRDQLAQTSGSSVGPVSPTVGTVARLKVPLQMLACVLLRNVFQSIGLPPGLSTSSDSSLPMDHVAVRRTAGALPAVAVSSWSSSRRSSHNSVCSEVVSLHIPPADVQRLASGPGRLAPPRAQYLQTSLAVSRPYLDRDKVDHKESNTSSIPLVSYVQVSHEARGGHRPSPVPVDTTGAALERIRSLLVRVDQGGRARQAWQNSRVSPTLPPTPGDRKN